MAICKATDCKYNCRISVAGSCCNYLTMTGELRTVENIDGEVVRKHLIKDGKCDLYRKRVSDEKVDSDSDGLLDGSGGNIVRQGRGED